MDMIKLQKIKLKARVLDKCHKIVVVACGYRLQFDAPETNFKKIHVTGAIQTIP